MLWVVLTAVIFLALIAGLLSSSWSVHRRAVDRLRRLPARKRKRARVAEFSVFGANDDPSGPSAAAEGTSFGLLAGGDSGGGSGAGGGGGGDGGGCD